MRLSWRQSRLPRSSRPLRTPRLAVAAVAAFGLAGLAVPGAASGAARGPAAFAPEGGIVQDGTYVLVNASTGRCLDDSVAYGLRTFVCNNQSFQQWRLHGLNEAGTLWTLTNLNTHRCVDDSVAYHLRSFGCNNQAFQRFWVGADSRTGTPIAWFQNQTTTGCMNDDPRVGLQSAGCDGRNTEKWELEH